MGLLRLIGRLLGFGSDEPAAPSDHSPSSHTPGDLGTSTAHPSRSKKRRTGFVGQPLRHKLRPLRHQSSLPKTPPEAESVESPTPPYAFARFGPFRNTYLDLSRDSDPNWLREFGLPELTTPEDLADWLGFPIGQVAWLTGRFDPGVRPTSLKTWHYTPKWLPKRNGGHRLLEIPKPKLKAVQSQILDGILNHIPAHRAAHGFVKGRSILTNAAPHTNAAVVLKMDLADFYPSVSYNRVVAIFRTIGFSRDVAMWLARLTTSATPSVLKSPTRRGQAWLDTRWHDRHLPQGAPTSPALANLSAYALDVRLSGLAKKYRADYTRYADDLTFSGDGRFIPALRQFIPLAEQIIRDERFRVNKAKRQVLRPHQRMTVTGVVVNRHTNISRRDYDVLKATLHNCVRKGPASQNRDQHADFAAHLRGRVEHVRQLNPARGDKLLAIYQQIDWSA